MKKSHDLNSVTPSGNFGEQTKISDRTLALNNVTNQAKLSKCGSQRYAILEALFRARGNKIGLDQLGRLSHSRNVSTVISAIRLNYSAVIEHEEIHEGLTVKSSHWLTNWESFIELFNEKEVAL